YGSVPAGASADASYLVTPASCPAPAPSLAVRSGSAVTTVAVPLPVACARLPLEVVAATWDDRARGNADGMPEAGETARVTLQLKNIGDAVMRDVGGTLDPRDAVVRGAASFGDISPGATATSVSSLLVTMKRGAPSVPGECSGRFMVNGVDLDSHATVVRLGGVQGIVQLLGTFHARADNRRTDVPVRNSLTCAQDAAFRLPTPAPAGPLKLQLVAMLAAFVALGVALRRRRMIAAFIRTRAIPSIARRRSR
ncbi:MAG TPA: hypothetical protein VL332_10155, partial [Candidatus Saccharimonadaceae bacterium]|nr:hypothetical protein [Candidatus Saccharimonadaceae bacterium]